MQPLETQVFMDNTTNKYAFRHNNLPNMKEIEQYGQIKLTRSHWFDENGNYSQTPSHSL